MQQPDDSKQATKKAIGPSSNLKKLTFEQLKEREKDLDTEIDQEIEKAKITEDFVNTIKLSDFEN